MHLYAVYQHFTADVDLVDASLNHVAAPLDDFQLFYSGARIYFSAEAPRSQESEPALRGRLFFELGRVPSRCCTAATGSIGLAGIFKPSRVLTTIPLGLHWLSREAILVVRRSTMRRSFAIAGLAAGLLLGCGPAFAFQQETPPPPEAARGTPQTNAPALQLGTPGTSAVDSKAESGGLKMFGYTVMPKLNFGLELLYGDGQPQLDLQQAGPSFEDENRDVTVLGKVKRRF